MTHLHKAPKVFGFWLTGIYMTTLFSKNHIPRATERLRHFTYVEGVLCRFVPRD